MGISGSTSFLLSHSVPYSQTRSTFEHSSHSDAEAPSKPNSSPHNRHWLVPLPSTFLFILSSLSTKYLHRHNILRRQHPVQQSTLFVLVLNISPLADWRLSLCSTLFTQVATKSHTLHYLLPAKRDAEMTCRLWLSNKYQTVPDVHHITQSTMSKHWRKHI